MTLPLSSLWIIIVILSLGYVLAALMVGLWLGERGRRQATERFLVYGTPEDRRAPVVSRRPAKEAEDRIAEAGKEFSEEVIEAAVKDLKQQAKAQKLEGITDEQFRQDAIMLLSGQDVTA